MRSWGLPAEPVREILELGQFQKNDSGSYLAVGMGRSYGDVGLNPGGIVLRTEALNHFLDFEQKTGRLTCQSGVTLNQIQSLFGSRGFMLETTPGTSNVTIGGAIANDVHGKNHHRVGSFGACVESLNLLRTDGTTVSCSRTENVDLFRATIGGMGLTGFILSATIRLRQISSLYLEQETILFSGIDEFLQISSESERTHEHSVAWVDSSKGKRGRGFLMRANHCVDGDFKVLEHKAFSFPEIPVSVVNPFTNKLASFAYYQFNSRSKSKKRVNYRPFFYPLDSIKNWNNAYSRKGFFQYQLVMPFESAQQVVSDVLSVVANSGDQSFLSVLKTFGDKPAEGLLSFSRPGVTLALDLANRGNQTLETMNELDKIVQAGGGAVNLSKDARISKSFFEQSYPNFGEFSKFRDPNISSSLSRRLLGK
jgi:FAD/FMN-containing dehydrogenase